MPLLKFIIYYKLIIINCIVFNTLDEQYGRLQFPEACKAYIVLA